MDQFDLVSDIHLDFWLQEARLTHVDRLEYIDTFVDLILPEKGPSKVLAIAGDVGHFNKQNMRFFESLKRYYEHIVWVAGNHDFYLDNSKERYKYKHSSIYRHIEMKQLLSGIEGVHHLDGSTIEIDGVTFGGTSMWYDFSYSIQNLNMTRPEMYDVWTMKSNDQKYITGLPSQPLRMFENEKPKLDKIFDMSDIVVTHVGPDWSKIDTKYAIQPLTGCYFFDGKEYLERAADKIWCFGHIHDKQSYMKNGCWLVNNALGYPSERDGVLSKIANISLNSPY